MNDCDNPGPAVLHIEGRAIPPDVAEAAALVGAWTEQNNIRYWRMGDCAARDLVRDYESVLLGLGVTHLVAGPGGDQDAEIEAFREGPKGFIVVGRCISKAGESRWVCPLVRHDGSEVRLRVIVGKPGSRKGMFLGPFVPMPIGE